MGAAHVETLRTLESEGRVRLVSVADPFADRLAETKGALEGCGVRWYSDFEAMFREERGLDAVSICTPIPLHFRMTKAAIARGLFVYLEKPPVPTIQQLGELLALDRERKVAVGFQMIGSRLVRQLKRWRVDGSLGELRAIRVSAAWPRSDSYYQRAGWAGRVTLDGEPVFDGPATNANAHLVHTIMFLASEDMDGFAVPGEVEAELYRARPIESYDVAVIRGRFPTGVEFSCAVAHATEAHLPYRIELVGAKGRAWTGHNGDTVGNDLGLPIPPAPERDLFLISYRGFVEYAAGDRPRPYSRLEDALGYVLATNGAWLSSSGIGTIPAAHKRTYTQGDDGGFDVPGLAGWVQAAGGTGKCFSDLGVPWARRSRKVSLDGLRRIDFEPTKEAA